MLLASHALLCAAPAALAATVLAVAREPPTDVLNENIYARLWRSSQDRPSGSAAANYWPSHTKGAYNNSPAEDPNTEPGVYAKTSAAGWTAGFFPDALWQMYRRRTTLETRPPYDREPSTDEWLAMAQTWAEPLKANRDKKDTHDLGFLAKPLESATQITGDGRWLPNLQAMSTNLAARYVPTVGAIRSWDCDNSSVTAWCSHEDSTLVIIDNLMNLGLLARSAQVYTKNSTLLDLVVSHADQTLRHHVRPDGSSYHVCDYSGATGELYLCRTAQGLADESTWSRGQAWGIHGFAEVYTFTNDTRYLEVSMRMADWFIENLPGDGLPFWDFDAEPTPNTTPRDSSAAAIAASGLLLLQGQLTESGARDAKHDYKAASLALLEACVDLALAGKISFANMGQLGAATFIDTPANTEESRGFEAILMHATSMNRPDAPDPNYDTGLVYGDFYLVEAGNRLLEMS